MVEAKYFQKLKCENLGKFPNWHTNPKGFYKCDKCDNSGIIAGADITSTIKPILEGIELEIEICNKDAQDDDKEVSQHIIIGRVRSLEKAKQIIEENVITYAENIKIY